MAEAKKDSTRRSRGTAATQSALNRLLAARDEVDAETVSLREREEAVIAEFVQVALNRESVITARDAELEKLEQRMTAVREKVVPQLDELDQQTAVILFKLTELGRNADQVAKMTGVPVKKVRAMVKTARDSQGETKAAPEPKAPAPDTKPTSSASDEAAASS